MEQTEREKIELSNKIHPYFAGFTCDLLFWFSINTIFLTIVKKFNASQISIISGVAIFLTIILQRPALRIIKKIGNIKSVRLGLFLLLISAIIITFGKSFEIILFGHVIYHLAFFFTGMNSVILKRNLKATNREKDFAKLQGKISIIYSVITMIISFISGFIFNINNYLPMIFCIMSCIFNIFLSRYIYEYKIETEKTENKINGVSWNKLIIIIILAYGLLYATVETLQENGKLFILYKLKDFISENKSVVYLTIVIALSRIFRVLSNIFFYKIYMKTKNKYIILLNIAMFISILIMIIGNIMFSGNLACFVMAIGFCMILFIRDPIENFCKIELLNNCNIKEQEEAIHRFNLSRRIFRSLLAAVVGALLTKMKMVYIMVVLLILSLAYLGITINLSKTLNDVYDKK